MDGKESVCNAGDLDSDDPPEMGMATHSSSCLENSMDKKSLAGYSPWVRKESDTTERLTHTHTHTHTHMHYIEFIGNEIVVTGKRCYIDLLLVVSFIPEK